MKVNLSEEVLDELFQAVQAEEGKLSGGKKLGKGGKAIQGLRESKISFGNPNNSLIRLNKKLFKDIGLELSPIYAEQMKERFDFYYMTLSVSMQPARGVQFSRIECSLDYGPKGPNEPIVQNIFPKSEWKEMLRLGRAMNLGLNANLEWSAGVSTSDIPEIEKLPVQLKANIENTNNIKAFITIPEYVYELGKAEIAATGQGNSECFWRIEEPKLQKAQTVQFGIVFKVPKDTASIDLIGQVCADTDMKWLTANLKDVFAYLSDKFKNLLKQGNIPICSHEYWTLTLPK
jgi:hypothetical protein